MYVYYCNSILTIARKNRIYKEMIIYLTSLTEDLKSGGLHPGLHFMDNEAYTALNLIMMTMDIKYELVPLSNHIDRGFTEIGYVPKSRVIFKKNR